ncbi:uncharacterized protein TNCV_995741 [Trichonephila clavipes]|nr:uncharacterized protein TNCV_995741 [Trichonephila clavipes]
MLQNVYNLADLLDLALKVPEVGAVNFNILHTVLLTIINELRLHNVRPWVHIENPVLAKSALTKAKLEQKDSKIFKDIVNRLMVPVEEPPKPEKIEEAPPTSKERRFLKNVCHDRRPTTTNISPATTTVVTQTLCFNTHLTAAYESTHLAPKSCPCAVRMLSLTESATGHKKMEESRLMAQNTFSDQMTIEWEYYDFQRKS